VAADGGVLDFAYLRLTPGFTYNDNVMPINMISPDLKRGLYPTGIPVGTRLEVSGFPGIESTLTESTVGTGLHTYCQTRTRVMCMDNANLPDSYSGGPVVVRSKYGPVLIGIYSGFDSGSQAEVASDFTDLGLLDYLTNPHFMGLDNVMLYSGPNMTGQRVTIGDCTSSQTLDLRNFKYADGASVNDNTLSVSVFGPCSVTLTRDPNGTGIANEYRLSDGSLNEVGNKLATTAKINYLGSTGDGVFLYRNADFQGTPFPLGPADRAFPDWINAQASSIWFQRQHARFTAFVSDALDWTGTTMRSSESQANLGLSAVLPGQLTGWDNRIRSTQMQATA
jgi:hypothetical protein